MSATANGAPLKMFWGTAQISPMVLIAKPGSGIESGKDLVGKRVGVTKFGSLTDYLVRQLATSLGEPGSIKSVALGGPPEQTAALERGDIEAFIWSTDVGFSLEAAGKGKIIERFADLNGANDQYAGLDARPEYLKEHPDIAAGVAKAYQCGINWMQDESNFDEGAAFTAKFLGVDEAVAEKTYKEIVGHLTPNGEMNTDALQALAGSLPDMQIAKEVPELDSYHTDEIQKLVEDAK